MVRKTAFQMASTARLAGSLMLVCLLTTARGVAAPDPQAFVANLGRQAIEVLGPSVSQAQRTARFRQLFDQDFDLAGITRAVLGPYRRQLSPAQQQEFTTVFREATVQAYTKRLSQYAGEPFRVTGSRPAGDNEAIVTSRIERRDGQPLEIDWHVIDRNGRPLISDVYIDGVSMRASQRSTFAGIIQRNGGRADALVAVLRQQVAQEEPQVQAQPQPQPQPPQTGSSR